LRSLSRYHFRYQRSLPLAQVLVRNLDDHVVASLKLRAELKGKSLEQELRDLITDAAPLSVDERVAVSQRLRAAFAVDKFDVRAAIRAGRDDEFYDLEFADDLAVPAK
jgi:antitoxin FitA